MKEFPTITILPSPVFTTDAQNATVCVVENGFFDAAAIAYNQREFDVFNSPSDYRPKTWLNVPKDVITKLVGLHRAPARVIRDLAWV